MLGENVAHGDEVLAKCRYVWPARRAPTQYPGFMPGAELAWPVDITTGRYCLVVLRLLLVPPSGRAKLWIIGVSFGRGYADTGKHGQRQKGRYDGFHDHSPGLVISTLTAMRQGRLPLPYGLPRLR